MVTITSKPSPPSLVFSFPCLLLFYHVITIPNSSHPLFCHPALLPCPAPSLSYLANYLLEQRKHEAVDRPRETHGSVRPVWPASTIFACCNLLSSNRILNWEMNSCSPCLSSEYFFSCSWMLTCTIDRRVAATVDVGEMYFANEQTTTKGLWTTSRVCSQDTSHPHTRWQQPYDQWSRSASKSRRKNTPSWDKASRSSFLSPRFDSFYINLTHHDHV